MRFSIPAVRGWTCKDTVVAAVRLIEGDGTIRREVETFATTTAGLN
jgi:hypothetical protein